MKRSVCIIIVFVMKNRQMSETLQIALLITFSGGLQDAYTYFAREHVFANAQTGNIVLMGAHLLDGDIGATLHYLFPVLAFAAGIFVAEQIQARFKQARRIHWRQIILLIEIIALTSSAFFNANLNSLANSLVSFSCALQVQTFRSTHGYPYASTMCIGNIRSGVSAISHYIRTHERESLVKSLHYFLVILTFALGATCGYWLIPHLGYQTILISSILLVIAIGFMFISDN